jgi:hypothetical protein
MVRKRRKRKTKKMPWKVKPTSDGQFQVVNIESGKVMGTHPSKARAGAQLRALYANVPEARRPAVKEAMLADDILDLYLEVPGLTDSVVSEKARKGRHGKRGNIAGLAKHILHQLGGDPHLFTKCMGFDILQGYDKEVRAEICARAHYIDTGIWPGAHGGNNPNANEPKYQAKYSEADSVRLTQSIKELAVERGEKAGIVVFKDYTGEYRWVTFSSNAYRDRDREIVKTKALEDDVVRADKERDYGPLRWWHVPGADMGDCDFNMMQGKILVESGTFRSNRIAEKMAQEAPNLQVSIGFFHPVNEPDGDGTFHHIRRFERSLLPAGRASNLLTQFAVRGVDKMATKEEKLQELRSRVGDDLADEILASADSTEKDASNLGLEFKEAKTEKAKAKKAPADDAEDPEEEGDMGEEEAETTEEDASESDEDEVAEEDEEEGEPAPRFGKKKEFEDQPVGSLTMGEFAELVAGAMSTALQPYVEAIKEAQGEIETMKETVQKIVGTRTKETSALQARLEKAEKRLKELEGDMPSAMREGYKASEDEDTVVPEGSPILKQAPAADPIGDFFTNFLNPAQ